MRVVFVNPVPGETAKVYTGYNHGIGCLSAVAGLKGHQTALVTFSRRDRAAIGQISGFEPDVVALTATSAQWPLAAWAAGEVSRALPETPVIAGGVHSTVATEEVIETPGVWAACRGEGEKAFLDILSGFEFGEWEETKGFWTRPQVAGGVGPTTIVQRDQAARPGASAGETNVSRFPVPPPTAGQDSCAGGAAHPPWHTPITEVVKNQPAGLVDLATLPHPDREIYDYQAILDRNRANVGAEFIASRGCPYHCSYCVNPVMSDLTGGEWKRVRYREVDDMLDEIESVLARYDGVRMVGFHDDIFGLDKDWLRAFAERYRSRVGLPFWCNQRVGCFDEEDVKTLREAGCFRVHMGIESADDTLRRDILDRDISSEAIEEAFAMLRRHGLKTVAFNMIGVPYETEETLRATVDLNRRIRPDWLVVSIFSPFPGTRLAALAREKGWLSRPLPESYYDSGSALDQPSISREKLLHYYENFVGLVYDKPPARNV